MPRTINLPKLRKHPKGSVVVLDGKYLYCGPYGSIEVRQRYERLIAEWLANGRRLPSPQPNDSELTIDELLLDYWTFVKTYYVKDGRPTTSRTRSVRLSASCENFMAPPLPLPSRRLLSKQSGRP